MKNVIKLIIIASVFLFHKNGLKAQCPGNCAQYYLASIPFSLEPNAGTSLTLGDDVLSGAVPIGFTFTFMCSSYTSLYVGSNGFLAFSNVSQGCCGGQWCPTAGGNPNNYVALDWTDLYPPGGGTIKYQTIGTAPNRIFVLTYSLIPYFANPGTKCSGQIKLFETTNDIEVHSASIMQDTYHLQTQGIMNNTGTAGWPIPFRNSTQWTATNDAYRWRTRSTLPCTGTPTPGILTYASPSTTNCGTYNSTLTLPFNVQSCGATYQWQIASNLAGPYTNISGATSSLAVVSNTSTNYYRCIVGCGSSTATSPPVTCFVPSCATPTPGSAVASVTTGCAYYFTFLSLTGAVFYCGNTYQWQSATNIAGPYTNIVGATSTTTFVPTSTVTTYFRCLLSCGGNTAASTPVTASVTTCVGTPTPGSSVASQTLGCIDYNTTLSLTGNVPACSVAYQWQTATNIAGPYTNIATANTSVSVVHTNTVTTYYRCLLTCGSSTALSVPVTCSVTGGCVQCPTCTSYTMASIPYSFTPSSSNYVWLNWADVQGPFPIGFTFTFMCNYYSEVYISSNGFISFNPTFNPGCCSGGQICPTLAGDPNEYIALCWTDLDPTWYGTVDYQTIGTVPNRVFIVTFSTLPYSSYSGNDISGQIKLYEASNYIEIHSTNIINDFSYTQTQGIMNKTGTLGFTTPGRNASFWGASSDAYRFGYCNYNPLPVELVDYYLTYKNTSCDVNWVTATEKNTDFYIIEKSTNGKEYTFFNKVKAAGNSDVKKEYVVTDFYPNKNGLTYYRIKQYDIGSNEPKLNLVRVLNITDNGAQNLKVQPNPATTNLQLLLGSKFSGNVTIQVFDNKGNRVINLPHYAGGTAASQKYNLNVETLSNGMYLLQVFNEKGDVEKTTFIKN